MARQGCVVDSMLLVLLVAGRTDLNIIGRHSRLASYSIADFLRLETLIGDWGGMVWVTPNTLTEASNLLGQHFSPERERLLTSLRAAIEEGREVLVRSIDAAMRPVFVELGLTDAAVLSLASADRPLLTSDGKLYAFALADDPQSALNFHHYREPEIASE